MQEIYKLSNKIKRTYNIIIHVLSYNNIIHGVLHEDLRIVHF